MNTPEKIAQAYLRLNGFFTIPHFTVLKENGGHIDLLAVRLGGCSESVGVGSNQKQLGIDNDLLSKLGINKSITIGLVIEVKGGNNSVDINDSQFAYSKSFFRNINIIKKVSFENRADLEIHTRNDQIIIPLKHCMNFIKKRFSELKSIES